MCIHFFIFCGTPVYIYIYIYIPVFRGILQLPSPRQRAKCHLGTFVFTFTINGVTSLKTPLVFLVVTAVRMSNLMGYNCEILVSDGGNYAEYGLLECDTVQFGITVPRFQRTLLLLLSRWNRNMFIFP